VETINGKIFVIHKVEIGETLYGISKRYGATVDAVLQANPTADGGLEVGQILKVPYTPRAISRVSSGTTHRVAEKETLYSISKLYGASVDDIKQWNGLSGNSLSVGQELIVRKSGTTNTVVQQKSTSPITSRKGVHTVAAKETMFSISKLYGITVQQLKDWNNLQSNEISIGQTLYVAQPEQSGMVTVQETPTEVTKVPEIKTQPQVVVVPEVKQPETKQPVIVISEGVKGSDEYLESGLAELIEGTEANRKYLALHRTAPVGTILKVKNEMNNREVFVRVMGKLPDTAVTDKLIIKISKSAYNRLGAIDPRFRVQVTYYK